MPKILTREEIEALYRREYGAILATLIRRLGDFDVAEEALQEAFEAAIQQWPEEGAPDEPVAWIVQTAKHKAIDRLRRGSLYTEKLGAVAEIAATERAEGTADAPTIPDDLLKSLMNYDWPGNVRELRSTIEKAMILSDGEVLNHEYIRINGDDKEVSVRTDGNKMTLEISLDDSSLDDIEQKIIRNTLESNDWNQTRTARILKMNRQNLRYRMKKMGLLN